VGKRRAVCASPHFGAGGVQGQGRQAFQPTGEVENLDVSVNAQRHGRVRVTRESLNDFDGCPGLDKVTDKRVAQAVEIEVLGQAGGGEITAEHRRGITQQSEQRYFC
jgi:hypothetical protein